MDRTVSFLQEEFLPMNMPFMYEHHNNEEVIFFLRSTNMAHPDLTHIYSIGKSNNGECKNDLIRKTTLKFYTTCD